MFPIIFHSLSLLAPLTDDGFKRPGIDHVRGVHRLPPLGPNLTPFRPANSDALNLNIAGFSRKSILTTQKEKIQDISEK